MNNTDLPNFNQTHRPPIGTLIIVAIAVFIIAIFALWMLGVPQITQIFDQLATGQENPPIWLQVNPITNIYYVLIPTFVTFLTILLVRKISPEQQTWSRLLIVSIILLLIGHYVIWRTFASLNFATPLNGFFSLLLLALEMYFIFRNGFQAFLLLKFKDRHQEAEENALAVKSGKFTPSVDILIPTYNEPASIIQRTVIGCQALEYTNKKIYILDDTRREEIKNLAVKLGCEYLTRPDNKYAKAGNLNQAIAKTFSDLIVIFDVDFIPTKDFLTRTVGFFQDPNLGFLQTSQDFYNADLIAHNLGLSDILPHATENYYSHYQLLRDGVDCTGCSGSSMVLKREALTKIGGFVTTSLSEDYFTGISISAQGYKSVYFNEKLSAGLGTENMTSNLSQRLRWGRGTLQGFFIKENPLTIPGLKLIQRITHLEEGLFSWIGDFPRVCLLVIPFICVCFDITPIQANLAEIIYFLLPYYLAYFTAYTWLNRKTQSFLIGDIYTSIHCVPLAINFIKVMFDPFSEGFNVTPKGISRDGLVFHWNLAFPLIGLLVINFLVFGCSIFEIDSDQNPIQLTVIAIIWSAYNIILISCILSSLLDAPKENTEWFKKQKLVAIKPLNSNNFLPLSAMTTEISEWGIKVTLNQPIPEQIISLEKQPVTLELIEDKIEFVGNITTIETTKELSKIAIMFENLSLNQQRYLVEMLFCNPRQWQRRETPEDWQILGLLCNNAAKQIQKYFLHQFLVKTAK